MHRYIRKANDHTRSLALLSLSRVGSRGINFSILIN